MTIFPAVLTGPETNTFTDHHGVLISYVGEDGGLVALGHHDLDEARAAFLAFDSYALDDTDDLLVTWAVLTDPTPSEGEDYPWWMEWGVSKDTPGAFPVMVVEA
jgi:hypothetical protein